MQYNETETWTVQLSGSKTHVIEMHSLYDQRDSGVVVSSNNSVDLDVRLIDEELLYADESEADKIMKKLKERM